MKQLKVKEGQTWGASKTKSLSQNASFGVNILLMLKTRAKVRWLGPKTTCCTAQLTASLLIEFQSLRGGLQSADAQTRNHLPLPYLEHRLHNLNNLVLACELKPVPIEIQPTLECFLTT